ncbi:MAG: hypothetical protein Q4P84_04800 [Elusimicrobiales bacterium]|nr:hypothetical protein [Elusimicrobiales bacterium]
MARQKVCVCCGEKIGADEVPIPYKGRYAHQKCFNVAVKVIQMGKSEKLEEKAKEKKKSGQKVKPKAELKDALSEDEYQEKKQYYDYLRKLIGEDQLPAKVYALSEDYIKRYGFSFEFMYQTLVYLNEIIEKELTGDVVGLIPYYYTEAEKYYNSIKAVEDAVKDQDISQMYHERVIQVQPKKRKIKQIDIGSIRMGE